jgi:hypothetical protein
MKWFKNSFLVKDVQVDWSNWSEYELGSVDNFQLKSLSYNDSGEYKCVAIDHATNRSWATNLIKIEVIDPKVNNLVNNKSFWISLLLFSICFVIFNLVVLSKNFIIKNKTKFKD